MLTKGEKIFNRPEDYKDAATLRGTCREKETYLKGACQLIQDVRSLYVQCMA